MASSAELKDVGTQDAAQALAEAFQWKNPQILGYHHPAYQNVLTGILGDELRCFTARRDTGTLAGVLPYRKTSTTRGVVINCFPFFGSNGLAVADTDAADDIVNFLLTAFRDRARASDVFSAAFYSPLGAQVGVISDVLGPDEQLFKFTQYLALGDSVPVWPAKRRGDLKRAQERGFGSRSATLADEPVIWGIYSDNCRAAGIPVKPRPFLRQTLEMFVRLGELSPMQWRVATLEGRVVAALLYGRGPLTGSYILPCASADVRQSQPNAFLLDHAIRESQRQGVRYWNFESSPEWGDAVFKFKERWGAQAISFRICLLYGNRKKRPEAADIAAVRAEAPYYFVAPVGKPTGIWPDTMPLPDPYAAVLAMS
jgi:hypothetical protein